MLSESPFDREEKIDGVRGLAYALRSMAVIYLMCDLRDLGVAVVDTLQDQKLDREQLRHKQPAGPIREAFQPNVYLYDKYPGGIGFSKTLYEQHSALLTAVRNLVMGCVCRSGCLSCTGPPLGQGYHTKSVVLYLVNNAL